MVLVPTRSLADTLQSSISDFHIDQGHAVWEAPNILVWSDYLQALWQQNRAQISSAQTLINSQQSLLIWTKVVELTRRQERELTLLNVQQTAKAVQRSWRLMHDWCLDTKQLEQDHAVDIDKFLQWLSEYQEVLSRKSLLDEPSLITALAESPELSFPFKSVYWYSYDLITDAQQQLNQLAEKHGVSIEILELESQGNQQQQFYEYQDSSVEINSALYKARELIEADNSHRVNLVIPDLQNRQAQVREMARDVFYPNRSPREIQLSDSAYRFTLGLPLAQWAAVETALHVIKLLNNNSNAIEVSSLLRNQFISFGRKYKQEARLFDRWLKRQRIRRILVDQLPALYEQCLEWLKNRNRPVDEPLLLEKLRELRDLRQEFQSRLIQHNQNNSNSNKSEQHKPSNNYAALSFQEWSNVYQQWLSAWEWQTATNDDDAMDTVQYQLRERWDRLLQEFSGLSLVQRQAGMVRAHDILRQLATDTIFLPKASPAPLLISGVYESIGQTADTCLLVGMNQNFPEQAPNDAFIPKRLLAATGFPDASPESSFIQSRKVIQSVLASAKAAFISYARFDQSDPDVVAKPSALFRMVDFLPAPPPVADHTEAQLSNAVAQVEYLDTTGLAWPMNKHSLGGTAIFENQSNCAFKAYLTHRLGFDREQESEFGLDGLDRGTVVHRILELAWKRIQTQEALKKLFEAGREAELMELICGVVDQALADPKLQLSTDKYELLGLERTRLIRLLRNWLVLEVARPSGFSVIEREQEYIGEIGGIEFKFIVDRLDITDDGRTIIIDYKTGATSRADWVGERVRKPQLPLYSVALDMVKRKPVSGIAYAKVDSIKNEFQELSETDIIRPEANWRARSNAEQWQEERDTWQHKFTSLANDFINGDARVNPIDEKTCQYCELASVCRVSQLKSQTSDHASTLG